MEETRTEQVASSASAGYESSPEPKSFRLKEPTPSLGIGNGLRAAFTNTNQFLTSNAEFAALQQKNFDYMRSVLSTSNYPPSSSYLPISHSTSIANASIQPHSIPLVKDPTVQLQLRNEPEVLPGDKEAQPNSVTVSSITGAKQRRVSVDKNNKDRIPGVTAAKFHDPNPIFEETAENIVPEEFRKQKPKYQGKQPIAFTIPSNSGDESENKPDRRKSSILKRINGYSSSSSSPVAAVSVNNSRRSSQLQQQQPKPTDSYRDKRNHMAEHKYAGGKSIEKVESGNDSEYESDYGDEPIIESYASSRIQTQSHTQASNQPAAINPDYYKYQQMFAQSQQQAQNEEDTEAGETSFNAYGQMDQTQSLNSRRSIEAEKQRLRMQYDQIVHKMAALSAETTDNERLVEFSPAPNSYSRIHAQGLFKYSKHGSMLDRIKAIEYQHWAAQMEAITTEEKRAAFRKLQGNNNKTITNRIPARESDSYLNAKRRRDRALLYGKRIDATRYQNPSNPGPSTDNKKWKYFYHE